MVIGVARRIAAAGALAAAAGLLATVTAAGAAGASQQSAAPQRRQIGVAQLSGFKVVLTVTRRTGQPPTATVTAAGYQRSGAGWKLISVQRIGARYTWFWNAVETCSLDITQYQPGSPVQNVDSIKVILLATPALGCTKPFSEHWKP